MTVLQPFRLLPEYRDYVWGSDRLRPGYSPTAEAWVVYEKDRIADGVFTGRSLGDVATAIGSELLGKPAVEKTGLRFPLLIKLLDCAQWLSLQVHPNDTQALALEGPGFIGKTEAWHVVEADPGAEILCGLQTPVDREVLSADIRKGKLLEHLRRMQVHAGETIFIKPGMLHALGPGLLIYEIQQTSDLTYRVWDWDRPVSVGRKLHIEQSLVVIDTNAVAIAITQPPVKEAAVRRLVACEYFELEKIEGSHCRFDADTRGETFHVLTVIRGRARVENHGWQSRLAKYETLLIPAGSFNYTIIPEPEVQILRASVPIMVE
jgi:mannose-6-phosphate isomerase